ncbi:ras-related protein Rab-33B-like isoform X2 [Macrobrachium rosenbergii]|uniref:ras-related protein Rab-33B-like isoform X2 n=1 Tax=Macrobrachium rosenbergii TaxID=79674 RepID=UPI0034D7AC5F
MRWINLSSIINKTDLGAIRLRITTEERTSADAPWRTPGNKDTSNHFDVSADKCTMSNNSTQTFAQSGALLRDRRQKTFKIIVIGDSSVGKTCLTFRFCGGQFPERTEATIGVDFREKRLRIDNEDIVSLPLWIEECNMNSLSYNIPRILVGNKCDCKDQLAVPTNVAQRFADQHSMPLFETSAKDDSDCDHVEAIFMTLAHKLKASKPMMPIDPSQFLPEDLHRAEVVSIGRERNGMEVESSSSCYC